MILEQITEQLTETLETRVLTLFGHALDRVVLQSPPRLAMGDLATPLCLELAKVLKRKPRPWMIRVPAHTSLRQATVPGHPCTLER